MRDSLSGLEQSVADLSYAIQRLERRIAALEERAGMACPETVSPLLPLTAGLRGQPAAGETERAGVLTLIGRTCLVLGGAYLLRYLTDAGTLPRAVGTSVGLAYALAWLAFAWRAAAGSLRISATFHAGATALIAFPLLWEATTKFHLLSPAGAAVAMALVTATAMTVAWRQRIQSVAWIITSAGLLAALLFMAVGPAVPMGLYLAFLGVFTLWCGYSLDWIWLRWPVALVADLTVLGIVMTASEVWHRDEIGAVLLVQVVLFAGYLASFAARTLWRSRDVIPFEVFQTIALLVVGFGGAVYLMVTTGSSAAPLGVASLVFGACSYGVAFAFVDWRRGHWKNFVFYASLAVVFILAGTALSVESAAQALVWSGLGVVSALAGRRQGSITLSSHTAFYTIAAAIQSGLLLHATDGFVASTARAWAPFAPSAVVVLFTAGLGCATRLSGANESWGGYSRLPKIALVITLLWCAGGTLIAFVAPAVAGIPGSGADAAVVAGVRTVVLGGSALALGWSSRWLFAEGRWLMYLLLVAGALKLVVEDFPQGRAATLMLAFAVYGTALILGPRLVARPGRAAAEPPAAATQG